MIALINANVFLHRIYKRMKMSSSVSKWGNSLAVRIPSWLAGEMNLEEGTQVDLSIVEGALVVRPIARKRYSLEELVERIMPDNCHAEIKSEPAVGNEFW